MLRHNNHYHGRSTWTGSPAQRRRHRKDIFWMLGLIIGTDHKLRQRRLCGWGGVLALEFISNYISSE